MWGASMSTLVIRGKAKNDIGVAPVHAVVELIVEAWAPGATEGQLTSLNTLVRQ